MISTTSSTARRPAAWLLAGMIGGAVLLTGLAGCATTPNAPGTRAATRSPLMAQAGELARNSATLTGAARTANETQINALLAQLDDATLQRETAALPAGDPLYTFAGRALLKRGLPLPRPFDRSAWKFDAGNRPPAESDGYRPPVKLAVLLPLSGSLSAAAAPVRDGFLAGYYGETRRRPEIAFYDTAGTATGAMAAYDQAVAAGNDFVVGPLGRDEVSTLFQREGLPVPVLALNRGNAAPPAGQASFSLAPEDEGIAAADYLAAHGAKRVLAISADDESQRRATAAFRARLAERGGTVETVSDTTADFAPFAAKEGGLDAVFLATRGSTARAVMPRLALAGLGGKPRVSTSHLLSGTGKTAEDRVLDGIAFPSESWNVLSVRGLPTAASAGAMLPNARGGAARLFAFGFDAWLITAYLEHLAHSTQGLAGATGVLSIDDQGQVQRSPAWSTFSAGTQVPLANADRR